VSRKSPEKQKALCVVESAVRNLASDQSAASAIVNDVAEHLWSLGGHTDAAAALEKLAHVVAAEGRRYDELLGQLGRLRHGETSWARIELPCPPGYATAARPPRPSEDRGLVRRGVR